VSYLAVTIASKFITRMLAISGARSIYERNFSGGGLSAMSSAIAVGGASGYWKSQARLAALASGARERKGGLPP
jgi:hypothetical protein